MSSLQTKKLMLTVVTKLHIGQEKKTKTIKQQIKASHQSHIKKMKELRLKLESSHPCIPQTQNSIIHRVELCINNANQNVSTHYQ